MPEVPVILKILAQRSSSVGEVISKIKEEFKNLSGLVRGVSRSTEDLAKSAALSQSSNSAKKAEEDYKKLNSAIKDAVDKTNQLAEASKKASEKGSASKAVSEPEKLARNEEKEAARKSLAQQRAEEKATAAAEREALRRSKAQEKAAEMATAAAEREAQRLAKLQEKTAAKSAENAEKEAQRLARAQEKASQKATALAEKEALKQASAQEKAQKKAAETAEKLALKQAAAQEKAQKKATETAEREALKQAAAQEKAQKKAEALLAGGGGAGGSQYQKAFERFGISAADALERVGQAALGISAIFSGASLYVIRVAAQFEQLQAKLQSVTGSAEAADRSFQKALSFAAKTPYDVQSIVQATILIEAFGQSSQKVLPLSANLAAAFGERIEDVARILGRAYSGSLEGYESLRNRLGITTIDLKRFGVETNKTEGLVVNTTASLNKARDALEKIIKIRYGDAVERQSKTLFGTLSNFGDAIQRASASVGSSLIPLATTVTKALTTITEKFELLPAPVKTATALFLVTGAAVAGVVAATSLAGAAFFTAASGAVSLARTYTEIRNQAAEAALAINAANAAAARTSIVAANQNRLALGVAAQSLGGISSAVASTSAASSAAVVASGKAAQAVGAEAAAVGQASTSWATLSATIGGAARAAQAFFAANVAARLGAVAAAISAVIGSYVLYQDYANNKMDETTKAQARSLTESANNFRNLNEMIRQVTGSTSELLRSSKDIRQYAEGLNQAFAGLTPVEVVRRLQDLGLSFEDVKKEADKNRQAIEANREKLMALYQVQELISRGGLADYFVNYLNPAMGLLGKTNKDLDASMALVQKELGLTVPTAAAVEEAIKRLTLSYGQVSSAGLGFNKFLEEFQETSKYLDKATKSAESFQTYIRHAADTKNQSALQTALGQTRERIAQVNSDLAKIGLSGNRKDLVGKLIDPAIKDEQKKAIEAVLRLYESEEQLVKKIADGDKAAITERLRAVENSIEKKKILNQTNFDAEVNQLRQLLAITGLTTEEELQIRRKLREFEDQLRDKQVSGTKAKFQALLLDSREKIEALKADGSNSAVTVSSGYQSVIQTLKGFEKQYASVIAKSPEFKNEIKSALLEFEKAGDKAKRAVPTEILDNAIKKAKEFGTEAVTNQQKLSAVQQGLDVLQRLSESGQIKSLQDKKKLGNEINELKKAEAKLNKDITKELDQQKKVTDDIVRANFEKNLELLKTEQAVSGKDNSSKIKQGEQQVLADKIQQIRDQERIEIDSGVSKEEARRRTELRITAFVEAETLKRLQEQQKEVDAADKAAKEKEAIQARLSGLRANRFGGGNSPFQSVEELGLESQLQFYVPPPSFDRPVPQSVSQIRNTVQRDIEEGERNRQDSQRRGVAQSDPFAKKQAGLNPGGSISVTVGNISTEDPVVKQKAEQFAKALVSSARNKLLGKGNR